MNVHCTSILQLGSENIEKELNAPKWIYFKKSHGDVAFVWNCPSHQET